MNTLSVEFFEAQFQRQAAEGEAQLNPFERLALDYLEGTLLDLGCGLGNLSLAAARRGHPVLAVDASPTAVQHLRSTALRESLDLEALEADVARWPIRSDHDTVLMIGLLSYLAKDSAYALLARAQRHTRPGGILAINVLREGTTWGQEFRGAEFHLFNRGELEAEFADWQVLESQAETFAAPLDTRKEVLTIIARKAAG